MWAGQLGANTPMRDPGPRAGGLRSPAAFRSDACMAPWYPSALVETRQESRKRGRFAPARPPPGRRSAAGEDPLSQGERALAFEVIEPADASIPPYLLIRDTWVLSEGESVRKSEITETAVLTVPEPYAPFVPWLPETFSLYTSP